MTDDLRALGNVILVRQEVLRAAFGQLLTCLMRQGSFDAQPFLERLHILHSLMPSPSAAATAMERLQAEAGLEEIQALIAMAETAIADAEEED